MLEISLNLNVFRNPDVRLIIAVFYMPKTTSNQCREILCWLFSMVCFVLLKSISNFNTRSVSFCSLFSSRTKIAQRLMHQGTIGGSRSFPTLQLQALVIFWEHINFVSTTWKRILEIHVVITDSSFYCDDLKVQWKLYCEEILPRHLLIRTDRTSFVQVFKPLSWHQLTLF